MKSFTATRDIPFAPGMEITAEKSHDSQEKTGHIETIPIIDMHQAYRDSGITWKDKSSLKLFYFVFVACCCQFANGFDGSLMTGILSMPYFQHTFHTGTTGPKVSLIASLYTVGNMVTFPLAAWLSDRFGRRRGMFTGAAIILVGMIIAATGKTIPQFAIGRFVLGAGITVMNVCAPAYVMESAAPQWRGRCAGVYQCGWWAGSIVAAATCYGTNFVNNEFSWRVPVILQAVATIFIMVNTFFIPESPRFLMANGREDEAIRFLTKYHGGGDPESPLVTLQLAELLQAIQMDGADKRWWDYRPLFRTHNGRWRILQVLMIGVFGQYTGNGLSYFNTVIYKTLGITTVDKQLAYNLLYSVVSATSGLIGASQADRLSRRKVLISGTLASAILLGIMVGLQSQIAIHGTYTNKNILRAALATYFLFSVAHTSSYLPMQAIIPTEAMTTELRAKGLSLFAFTTGAMGFINQFAAPIALGNIGYHYVLVFVIFDIIVAGVWWALLVEGRGRTLEELDYCYDQKNPVKASLRKEPVTAQE